MVALIREPPGDGGPDAAHLAAVEPGRGRRLGGGAQGGRRRPPPGRRLLERATRSSEIAEFIRREFVAATGGVGAADAAAGE